MVRYLAMAERNGSNRTQGYLELEAKHRHQKTYEDWWLGKLIETPYLKDGENIKGVAEKVKFIGNSIVGVVEITLDNGFIYLVGGSNKAFKPKRSDVVCVG